MKKTILYLATGFILLMSQACKKHTTSVSEVKETVNVSINANESYKYTLSGSCNSETYNIETASARSAMVEITNDNTGSTFVYTPAQNYSGTEAVIVSSIRGQQNSGSSCGFGSSGGGSGKCERNKGACRRDQQDCTSKTKHTITFNITVNGIQN